MQIAASWRLGMKPKPYVFPGLQFTKIWASTVDVIMGWKYLPKDFKMQVLAWVEKVIEHT